MYFEKFLVTASKSWQTASSPGVLRSNASQRTTASFLQMLTLYKYKRYTTNTAVDNLLMASSDDSAPLSDLSVSSRRIYDFRYSAIIYNNCTQNGIHILYDVEKIHGHPKLKD